MTTPPFRAEILRSFVKESGDRFVTAVHFLSSGGRSCLLYFTTDSPPVSSRAEAAGRSNKNLPLRGEKFALGGHKSRGQFHSGTAHGLLRSSVLRRMIPIGKSQASRVILLVWFCLQTRICCFGAVIGPASGALDDQYIFAPAGMWSSSIKRCSFSSPSSWCTAEISIPQDSMPIMGLGGRLVMAKRVFPTSSSGS